MSCNHDCNQGRHCDCLPIDMEEPSPSVYERLTDLVCGFLMAVGIFTVSALLAYTLVLWMGHRHA